jgi:hypothetical protein
MRIPKRVVAGAVALAVVVSTAPADAAQGYITSPCNSYDLWYINGTTHGTTYNFNFDVGDCASQDTMSVRLEYNVNGNPNQQAYSAWTWGSSAGMAVRQDRSNGIRRSQHRACASTGSSSCTSVYSRFP